MPTSSPQPVTKPWPGAPGSKKGETVPTTPPVTAKPPQAPEQADSVDASPQQAR